MTNIRYQRVPLTPINSESTHVSLDVDGEIPPDLDGLYVRNGPNQIGEVPPNLHYFSGHGMVHGVRLKDGKALWYRNRIVRTGSAPKVLGQSDPGGPITHNMDASPNTNVVIFDGRMYATIEAGASMVEIDQGLETITRSNLNGALEYGFTGHHKIDPDDQDIHGVVYSMTLGANAQYLRLSPTGEVLNNVVVPLTGATQIHDMSITENYAIIFDLNVVFDPSLLDRTTLPIKWDGEKPSRVGVLPKDGTSKDVRWFEVEPCYVYHPVNAFETNEGDVVIDVSRYPTASEKDLYGPLGDSQATVDRWTLPMKSKGPGFLKPQIARAIETRISELPLDFPRVSPLKQGRPYRYAYMVVATLTPSFEGAVKLDTQTGKIEHQSFEGGCVSELSFVPRDGGIEEDDGWLIGFCYDRARDRSRLVILDAQNFSGPPVTSIWIPDLRVPIGTHGDWYPGWGAAG